MYPHPAIITLICILTYFKTSFKKHESMFEIALLEKNICFDCQRSWMMWVRIDHFLHIFKRPFQTPLLQPEQIQWWLVVTLKTFLDFLKWQQCHFLFLMMKFFIQLKLPNAYTLIINKSYTGLCVGLHMESSCQISKNQINRTGIIFCIAT